MHRFLPALFLTLALVTGAAAETLVAAGTIRAQTVIGPADVVVVDAITPGALTRVEDAVGMEARVNLYPGRPVRPADLQPPAVIDRNQIITLRYENGGLLIVTEGRALDRAGIGDRLRVLNLESRNTVTGTVLGPALVAVGPLQ